MSRQLAGLKPLVSFVVVATLLGGCGNRSRGGLPPECEEAPLEYTLTPLGLASQQAFPDSTVTLKVLAVRTAGECIDSEDDVVPAKGDVIAWQVLGSSDASLSQDATITGDTGIAEVILNVGTLQSSTVQVQASAPGATPVTFSVRVRVDTKQLSIITPSPLDTAVDRTERVRVRLTRPSPGGGPGTPVRATEITAQFLGGTSNGAGIDGPSATSTTLLTDANGVATLRVRTGDVDGVTYTLEFCGSNSCEGVPSRSMTVNVAARAAAAGACEFFTDCEDGLVCDAGTCKFPDIFCNDTSDCPIGYACNNAARVCELSGGGGDCNTNADCTGGLVCGGGATCISPEGCQMQSDCLVGWTCDLASGACLPPPDEPALDVRGEWDTRYHFDISDTLPGFFTNGLLPVVSFLDLAFRSQLEINIPFVGDVLEGLIDSLIAEYVPPWVITVSRVLADFIILFQNLEATGEMVLTQSPTMPVLGTQVNGDELWTSVQVFIASLCPGGIQEFEMDPSCGTIDIILQPTFNVSYSNNDPTVGVKVDPFNGQVQGDQLRLLNRDVELELRQLVNVLLDVIVAAASDGQWWNFEDFIVDIVPCGELQIAIDDLACSITNGSVCQVAGVEAACDAAALAATTQVTQSLGEIPVGLELEFSTRARIRDSNSDNIAEFLGNPLDPANTMESAIVGDTDALFVFGGELDEDSWWYAER